MEKKNNAILFEKNSSELEIIVPNQFEVDSQKSTVEFKKNDKIEYSKYKGKCVC